MLLYHGAIYGLSMSFVPISPTQVLCLCLWKKKVLPVQKAPAFAGSRRGRWPALPPILCLWIIVKKKKKELAEDNLSGCKVKWSMFGLQHVTDMGTLMCNL